MITFFDDNSDLLLILFKWNLFEIIAKYNTQLVLNYVKEYDNPIIRAHPYYYICFESSAIFDMCILWISNDKNMSKEELFDLIQHFKNSEKSS